MRDYNTQRFKITLSLIIQMNKKNQIIVNIIVF